jgi:hypothetical protein
MPNKPYGAIYDGSTARTVGNVIDDPAGNQFLTVGSANKRTIVSGSGQASLVGDATMNHRGAKNIVWSSEGYTYNGVAVTAVTVAAKKTTGASTVQTTTAPLPGGFTLPATLDFSAYSTLVLIVNLSAITGTSIQFELDLIDDAPTPNVIAIWKPVALTAAGGYVVNLGLTATGTTPTPPSGYTFTNIPMCPGAQGKFVWTNIATTVATWTAIIYGIN